MSFHRLLEAGIVSGKRREAGALIDYRGPPVPDLEPLDVPEHNAWLAATQRQGAACDRREAA